MKYIGKESDLMLARLERFLSIPFPVGVGAVIVVVGALMVILGFGLWMTTSNWYSLLGGNMAYIGVILCFLGLEVKNHPGRLPLTPLVGLLGWFGIRRIFSLTLILDYRDDIGVLWPYSQFDFINCSARAELVGALGVFGFWCGWRLARHGRGVRNAVEPLIPPMDRSLWGAYGISLFLYGLNVAAPQTIGRLGSFGGKVIEMSSGIAFVVAVFWSVAKPSLSLLGSLLLMLPFSSGVLVGGMKSAFIQPLLPAFHALMLRSLRWPIVLSGMIVPFLLLFVFPYVKAYRDEVWNAKRDVKEGQLVKVVWGDVRKAGYHEAAISSFDQIKARYSSIGVTGAIINYVDTEGYLGPLFLANLSYGLIPRLLWPNKPAFEPATWFSDKLFGVTTTATALFLPTEWFWMFGWMGTFFGLAGMGYVYAWVHRYFLLNSLFGPVWFAGWFLLFSFIGQVEEVRSNTTVMMPILLFAAVWTMHGMARLVTLSFRERAVWPSTSIPGGGAGRGGKRGGTR